MFLHRRIAIEEPENDFESRKFTGLALLIILCLALLDIIVDLAQGVELVHISIEALVIPLAGAALYTVWSGFNRLGVENNLLKTDLARVSTAAAEWKSEAGRFLRGLSDAIDAQFAR